MFKAAQICFFFEWISFSITLWFRLLVQGIRDYAIFMLDPEGRIASWNEGAQRIKG